MYSSIQGKDYPKVESWLTLGAILGILPRERSVTELPDGSFEAQVDLINQLGAVVGGASAICGIEERRWASAERYARRSMAVTRATAKAYRLSFSWIIQLAGLEVTPIEEMPYVVEHHEEPKAQEAKQAERAPPEKPLVRHEGYDPQNRAHQTWLMGQLKLKAIPEERWDDVGAALSGRPSTDLADVLQGVT